MWKRREEKAEGERDAEGVDVTNARAFSDLSGGTAGQRTRNSCIFLREFAVWKESCSDFNGSKRG